MPHDALILAAEAVPAGPWAVGVSGGADSVALLALLHQRTDLSLHVVHVDHQIRGDESTGDALFVADLASRWNLPFTLMRRDQIEPTLDDLPANTSARLRKIRFAAFARAVQEKSLQGVILAHHADDQAETVLQRLLRSSGPTGLAGMTPQARLGRLVVLRPLLRVRREQLREYLKEINQPWRTDASNESPAYLRNQLRLILARHAMLSDALIDLAERCRDLRDWVRCTAPRLDEQFAMTTVAGLPDVLARESARRWLIDRGVPPPQIEPAVIERLLLMARDAASPHRQSFPDGVVVRRRGGKVFVQR